MKRLVGGLLTMFVALLSTDPGWSADGACGTANGTSVSTAPTANFCASGDPSSVAGNGPWTWSCSGSSGGASASCSANPGDRLSINLVGMTYYSAEIPFKDLMFQSLNSGDYGGGSCGRQTEDSEGYPLSLQLNCYYRYYLMLGAGPYPAGHYVLTYDGTGSGYINWDATNAQLVAPGRAEFDVTTAGMGINFVITATSPADHMRNIHVFLASDEATYQTQPFRQSLLDLIAPFRIIRFMDWSAVSVHMNISAFASGISQPDPYTLVLPPTASAVDDAYANDVATVNVGGLWPRLWVDHYDGATRTLHLASQAPLGTVTGVYIQDFPNRTWDQRTPLSNQRQQTASGAAYEYMVALCNTANKDMWITIPTAAGDDYVTQLAALLKNTLNPNLKIYIEYSNETWNFNYPGYDYSEAMQAKLGLLGSATVVPADAWHPYRALQIFHIFDQVFGEPDVRSDRNGSSRLVRVLSSQTGPGDRLRAVVDWTNTGNSAPTYGHHAYEYADAVAVTDYWAFPSGFDPLNPDITQLPTDQFIDQMIQLQKASIDEQVSPTGANGTNYLYLIAQGAQARGIKLVVYEGGESFAAPSDADPATASRIVAQLTAMNRDPRMADVYMESLTQWQTLSQEFPGTIGNWSQYNDVGACSKYGCWGLLDSLMQDPGTAPRYQGILNFLNANTLSPATF
jgi:hypothetical protein